MSCKIILFTQKGRKTWVGKIINHDFKLDFINDSIWVKGQTGMLEFEIKEEGYYMSQDSTGRKYWHVVPDEDADEDGKLKKEQIKKVDVINYLSDSEELEKKLKPRKFNFCVVKPAANGTAWELQYDYIENEIAYIAEDENYYMISGKFLKESKQYVRNFRGIGKLSRKEEIVDKLIISKKRDNVEIKFLDEDRKDLTRPVTIDNESIIISGPLNFVGVVNSVESR